MKFSLADTAEFNSIQRYDEASITISISQLSASPQRTERFERSVFISATQISTDFPASKISDLSFSDFQPLFELSKTLNLDVLLLGCNASPAILPSVLHDSFIKQGVGVECMSIGAACRTYNMLLNESRSVGALFFMA